MNRIWCLTLSFVLSLHSPFLYSQTESPPVRTATLSEEGVAKMKQVKDLLLESASKYDLKFYSAPHKSIPVEKVISGDFDYSNGLYTEDPSGAYISYTRLASSPDGQTLELHLGIYDKKFKWQNGQTVHITEKTDPKLIKAKLEIAGKELNKTVSKLEKQYAKSTHKDKGVQKRKVAGMFQIPDGLGVFVVIALSILPAIVLVGLVAVIGFALLEFKQAAYITVPKNLKVAAAVAGLFGSGYIIYKLTN